MANQDAPFGFRPVKTKSGTAVGHPTEYVIASGYATNMFKGDAVLLDTSGQVNIGVAGTAIAGIFAGCRYTAADGSVVFKNYWPASTVATDAVALVHDDPGLILEVQSDGTMTAADIGQFVNIDTSQAGSTANGQSRQQTSASGGAETNFRVVGMYGVGSNSKAVRDDGGNHVLSATGLNAVLLVSIAAHTAAGATVGVEI